MWYITQPYKSMKQCLLQQHGWPRDYRTKWSNSDRERQIPYDITHMWNLILNKWTYLQNRNRFTDVEKLMVAKGETWGGAVRDLGAD